MKTPPIGGQRAKRFRLCRSALFFHEVAPSTAKAGNRAWRFPKSPYRCGTAPDWFLRTSPVFPHYAPHIRVDGAPLQVYAVVFSVYRVWLLCQTAPSSSISSSLLSSTGNSFALLQLGMTPLPMIYSRNGLQLLKCTTQDEGVSKTWQSIHPIAAVKASWNLHS